MSQPVLQFYDSNKENANYRGGYTDVESEQHLVKLEWPKDQAWKLPLLTTSHCSLSI